MSKLYNPLDWANTLKRSVEHAGKIFDPVRKKWIKETPEELVRQMTLNYLIQAMHYPSSRIAVERRIQVFNLNKRFDIVVFNKQMEAHILFECKSPDTKLTQQTLNQAARYNFALKANYLCICNGHELVNYYIEQSSEEIRSHVNLPEYPF